MSTENNSIIAHPVRVIPFDLGRSLLADDADKISHYVSQNYSITELSRRQSSILKKCSMAFAINDHLTAFVYKKGIVVVVISEPPLDLTDSYDSFAIAYGENRKKAHNLLFKWEHRDSDTIFRVIDDLRGIVRGNAPKLKLRKSASVEFENRGLSYIMTFSMFDTKACGSAGFRCYPDWLKSNLYALLVPSVLYLEDSSKFEATNESGFDAKRILSEIAFDSDPKDFERHRHIDTYMSWSAVVISGQLQDTDREEYTALEVQLQSDWFYVYCLEKNLKDSTSASKKDIVEYQHISYELDLLENRLFDFDDSSMPGRILDIQRGLVETSGLESNIQHAKRKIKYILECEKLNSDLRQKKIGQSSEILLFVIAFIEIAPTVAEYGDKLFPYAGLIGNCLIALLGILLFLRKE